MPKPEESMWSAWCPLRHRVVAESADRGTVRAGWFAHAEEAHPSMAELREVS